MCKILYKNVYLFWNKTKTKHEAEVFTISLNLHL